MSRFREGGVEVEDGIGIWFKAFGDGDRISLSTLRDGPGSAELRSHAAALPREIQEVVDRYAAIGGFESEKCHYAVASSAASRVVVSKSGRLVLRTVENLHGIRCVSR